VQLERNPKAPEKTQEYTLMEVLEKFRSEKEHEYRDGTLVKYKGTATILENFLLLKKYRTKFSPLLSQIDIEFYNNFRTYLITEHSGTGITNESANNHLKNIKAVIKYYFDHGSPQMRSQINMDFLRFKKFKEIKQDREAISESEVSILYNEDMSKMPRLERVRDLYVFACYTGLQHGDVVTVRPTNLIHTEDGYELSWRQEKVNKKNNVPLEGPALEIIYKYKDCYETLLPPITDQKCNETLQEIWLRMLKKIPALKEKVERTKQKGKKRELIVAPRCEFLTFHTSRHTFARILIDKWASRSGITAASLSARSLVSSFVI
jgi:integrase